MVSLFSTVLKYFVELLGVAITYFAAAKLSLALASVHPSATPIWPPTALALAAVLLLGYRIWPAIFLAALIANAMTAGSIFTSVAIATGNTLESVVGASLIDRWSDGVRTFDTPAGVARFALICLIPSTMISATLGAVSLSLGGYADWANFASIWVTWWMGDLAGALVITPVIVLWTTSFPRSPARQEWMQSCVVFSAVTVIGLVAFSPIIEQKPRRDVAPALNRNGNGCERAIRKPGNICQSISCGYGSNNAPIDPIFLQLNRNRIGNCIVHHQHG
jgi:integral membrane sensor domain MASE1